MTDTDDRSPSDDAAGGPFELEISRYIDAPRAVVWRVWTERTVEWFAPKPWTTRIIAQDMRPGGRSSLVMSGPDGDTPPIEGVFLEVVPEVRIVTTDAYRVGWIPQPPFMTGLWEFADEGSGTRYTARSRHWTVEAKEQHEAMGFEQGWGVVADQLAALAEAEAGG